MGGGDGMDLDPNMDPELAMVRLYSSRSESPCLGRRGVASGDPFQLRLIGSS